ncbi:hypothetical protein [Aureimonas sp. N4]|uniref:hypothetical protein n=1 Tax=Aureimonas sp. N4 TaxID=1638165 RepID=UPI000782E051|nr:hypothetical protein [Aureimonas sp. N4]
MTAERQLSGDHTTIYRWILHDAPELDRRVQWRKPLQTQTSFVGETFVAVRDDTPVPQGTVPLDGQQPGW